MTAPCPTRETSAHCAKHGCIPVSGGAPVRAAHRVVCDGSLESAGSLAAFDKAVAAELPCVSVVPYNSHDICEWFAKNVRERMAKDAAAAPSPIPVVEAGGWMPIESAPKSTEVLVWRADSGPFIAKFVTPDEVIPTEEWERGASLSFPDDFEEWFSDAYGWQEGDERPTHWMTLPEAPK